MQFSLEMEETIKVCQMVFSRKDDVSADTPMLKRSFQLSHNHKNTVIVKPNCGSKEITKQNCSFIETRKQGGHGISSETLGIP